MAKTRAYTPTLDDVGYVLRCQMTIVDRLQPTLIGEVVSYPSPPLRDLH